MSEQRVMATVLRALGIGCFILTIEHLQGLILSIAGWDVPAIPGAALPA